MTSAETLQDFHDQGPVSGAGTGSWDCEPAWKVMAAAGLAMWVSDGKGSYRLPPELTLSYGAYAAERDRLRAQPRERGSQEEGVR